MFIVEMAIFVSSLTLVTVSSNFTVLLICLFGMGMALGCDYPTAHVIVSESIFQSNYFAVGSCLAPLGFPRAVGALAGTAVGLAYPAIKRVPQRLALDGYASATHNPCSARPGGPVFHPKKRTLGKRWSEAGRSGLESSGRASIVAPDAALRSPRCRAWLKWEIHP